MKTRVLSLALTSVVGLALCGGAAAAPGKALPYAQATCQMDFTLSGWSAIDKTASGKGKLTCGAKTVAVKLSAKGSGLTVDKYKITNGQATFSNVDTMQHIFGSYAMAQQVLGSYAIASAGVNKSRTAVMRKGGVTMTISGTGKGWDISVGFGSFTIKPVSGKTHHTQ